MQEVAIYGMGGAALILVSLGAAYVLEQRRKKQRAKDAEKLLARKEPTLKRPLKGSTAKRFDSGPPDIGILPADHKFRSGIQEEFKPASPGALAYQQNENSKPQRSTACVGEPGQNVPCSSPSSSPSCSDSPSSACGSD